MIISCYSLLITWQVITDASVKSIINSHLSYRVETLASCKHNEIELLRKYQVAVEREKFPTNAT